MPFVNAIVPKLMLNIETMGSKINVKISRVFLLLQGWSQQRPFKRKHHSSGDRHTYGTRPRESTWQLQ
jgi:hypothetical protein